MDNGPISKHLNMMAKGCLWENVTKPKTRSVGRVLAGYVAEVAALERLAEVAAELEGAPPELAEAVAHWQQVRSQQYD